MSEQIIDNEDDINKQSPEFVMKIIKEKLREMIKEANAQKDSSSEDKP